MSEPCPWCGAAEKRRYQCDEDEIIVMGCGTECYVSQEDDQLYPDGGDLSHDCLRRQLAQRDERIKELKTDLAALAPVVRAAVRYLLAREQRKASRGITPMMAAALGDLIAAVRALPADVRERLMALERMGVDRG